MSNNIVARPEGTELVRDALVSDFSCVVGKNGNVHTNLSVAGVCCGFFGGIGGPQGNHTWCG